MKSTFLKKTSIASLIILISGIILVILSYFFIDKPIAYFVYNHPIILHKLILQITYIPAIIIFAIVPIIIIGSLIYMTWKPLTKFFFISIFFSTEYWLYPAEIRSLRCIS